MPVRITKDKVASVLAAVKALTKYEVLVGIPGENAARDNAPGSPVTNVTLGYVHEFGSPAQNIPPRPFLVPGIRDALPQIIPRLRRAGLIALNLGNAAEITTQLISIGVIAASAVQMRITTGPFVPIKDATKRARLYRKASYRNASDMKRARMMEQWLAGDFSPLIDTGAMRQAVTFVVRPKR